ncbi:uncharacterized protein [Rutidosis leptorrhynchoides]|uniref:uncharacterized protein n=1 Tax=Rutidosis leptorrhynchoides TaxID=125765 RepID=UPI003A9A2B60
MTDDNLSKDILPFLTSSKRRKVCRTKRSADVSSSNNMITNIGVPSNVMNILSRKSDSSMSAKRRSLQRQNLSSYPSYTLPINESSMFSNLQGCSQSIHQSHSGDEQYSNSTSQSSPPIFTNIIYSANIYDGMTPFYQHLGRCDNVCIHCGAFFWLQETLTHTFSDHRIHYHQCCADGRVVIPSPKDPPILMKDLLQDGHFMTNIRAYNQMFSMTSLGAHIDETINNRGGPYVFKISGQIYHWIGSLCPEDGELPKFLQLYIYDTEYEVTNRMAHFGGHEGRKLSADIVVKLIEMLDTHNELVKLFRTAKDKLLDNDVPTFRIRLFSNSELRQYDLPTSHSIDAIVFDSGPKSVGDYNIIIEQRGRFPQRVNKLHPHYMSLQYPLAFVYGEQGFDPSMTLIDRSTNNKRKRGKVTMNMYYSYQLHSRIGVYDLLLRTGKLFQQYVVTAYCSIELSRIDYIRKKQEDIRNDYLAGIYDGINRGDQNGLDIGSRLILPASFTGGPIYMYSHYLDALAISQTHGNPKFFITFTCNSKWPEIQSFLSPFPHLTPTDRPDIVVRIYQQKLKQFLALIKEDEPFGHVKAVLYTVEFQKRGLPHCHTLIWTDLPLANVSPNDIDRYTSAEIPDPQIDPWGYKVVSDLMIHGPCGLDKPDAPCMKESNSSVTELKCSKKFPKTFNPETFSIKKDTLIIEGVILKKTTLTEWLTYNKDSSDGHHLTYKEFPSQFVWYASDKFWSRRRRYNDTVIGRLSYVHPAAGELFYLRMLLCHQHGCTSFLDIKTVNGRICGSYRTACEMLALLGNDREWDIALEEAIVSGTSSQIRNIFSNILMYCDVTNPAKLFKTHWKSVSDDIPLKIASNLGIEKLHINDPELQSYVLYELEILLIPFSKSVTDFGLPPIPRELLADLQNRLIMEEKNYDCNVLIADLKNMLPKMNVKQREIYDLVLHASDNNLQELLFIYGHGGTGKTFLWKSIITSIRSQGQIVLAVASSGIASLLLPSGQTAHSRFKIPIVLTDESMCNIKKKTHLSSLLLQTSLIVWDEAPMNDRRCFETLDRTLRDIMNNNETPFGGKLIIFGGDFRQTLPMKRNASKEETINSSIVNSYLWPYFKAFSSWILNIGNGNLGIPDEEDPSSTSWINIPPEYCIKDNENGMSNLISFIYNDVLLQNPTASLLQQQMIVCPKNSDADEINDSILCMVRREQTTYLSSDLATPRANDGGETELLYPIDYLNNLNYPSLPPHILQLKVGAPVILLRNINLAGGLCNAAALEAGPNSLRLLKEYMDYIQLQMVET